jgi:hypothetical protein
MWRMIAIGPGGAGSGTHDGKTVFQAISVFRTEPYQ